MRHVSILFVAATLCLVGAGTGALVFFAGDMPGRGEAREIAGTDLYGKELKLSQFRQPGIGDRRFPQIERSE